MFSGPAAFTSFKVVETSQNYVVVMANSTDDSLESVEFSIFTVGDGNSIANKTMVSAELRYWWIRQKQMKYFFFE